MCQPCAAITIDDPVKRSGSSLHGEPERERFTFVLAGACLTPPPAKMWDLAKPARSTVLRPSYVWETPAWASAQPGIASRSLAILELCAAIEPSGTSASPLDVRSFC